jgi:diamine N-acetyltransferase
MAFDTLTAHRLWLDVKEWNLRARTLYEREGFRYEGTLRECCKETTGYSSLIVMSILESEYRHHLAQST